MSKNKRNKVNKKNKNKKIININNLLQTQNQIWEGYWDPIIKVYSSPNYILKRVFPPYLPKNFDFFQIIFLRTPLDLT